MHMVLRSLSIVPLAVAMLWLQLMRGRACKTSQHFSCIMFSVWAHVQVPSLEFKLDKADHWSPLHKQRWHNQDVVINFLFNQSILKSLISMLMQPSCCDKPLTQSTLKSLISTLIHQTVALQPIYSLQTVALQPIYSLRSIAGWFYKVWMFAW